MLTNKANRVIYVGVTSDLVKRLWEHKDGVHPGFTKKYGCNKLVYFEKYQWIHDAIDREKQLKAGSRKAKVDLIILENPDWNDLSTGWYNE